MDGKKVKNVSAIKRRKAKVQGDAETNRSVISLRDLCIKALAENIECVDDFGDIPYSVKKRIAMILSRLRLIDKNTFRLFIGPKEERIELFDCARLNEGHLNEVVLMSFNLRTLNLSDCGQMTDLVVNSLTSTCTQLTSLTLKGPFLVSDTAWTMLFSSLGLKLEELFFENAAKLSTSAIETLAKECQNLKSLNLTLCESINDEGVTGLGALKKLEAFVLDDLGDVKDESIIEVLKGVGAGLKVLGLNGFLNMEDKVLIEGIAPNCTNLEKLMLRANESLSDEGMIQFMNVFQSRPGLRHLDIGRIVNLKDGSLTSIISLHGSTLEHLDINGLDYFTEYSLKCAFDGGLPRLREVDVSWVRSVDEDLLEMLMKKTPFLSKVRVYGCYRLTQFVLCKEHLNAAGETIKLIGNEFD
ncbi:hypothetical protein BC829DRAFT_384307 [Chytridium lagenaria]|nr:hypothetical protein BC829DRAFT_384307 [Chytridium lagenaria]